MLCQRQLLLVLWRDTALVSMGCYLCQNYYASVHMPVCNVHMSTCMCICQCAMCVCQHACAYSSVQCAYANMHVHMPVCVCNVCTRRQHICQCAIWICQHAYVNMLCQHAYAYGNLRMSVCNMYIPQLTTIIMHNYASVGIFL